MKRFLSVLMAMVFLFVLAGCGTQKTEALEEICNLRSTIPGDSIRGTYYLKGDACYRLKIQKCASDLYEVESCCDSQRRSEDQRYPLPEKQLPKTGQSVSLRSEEGKTMSVTRNRDGSVTTTGGVKSGTYYPAQSSLFLIPNSAEALFCPADLAPFTKEELGIARNEILARHGRAFAKEQYKTYFEKKPWYTAIHPAGDDSWTGGELNAAELQNIKTIQKMEENWDKIYRARHETYEKLKPVTYPKEMASALNFVGFSCMDEIIEYPVMSAALDLKTYQDHGDYATVEAVMAVGQHVPAAQAEKMKDGQSFQLCTNYMTGAKKTFYMSGDYREEYHNFLTQEHPKDPSFGEEGFFIYEPDDNYYLFIASMDREEAPVVKTTLYLMKDAYTGGSPGNFVLMAGFVKAYPDGYGALTSVMKDPDRLQYMGGYNAIIFNEKGYVTGLYCFGD